MLALKDREDRGRSIRAHILTYMKSGRVDELRKAHQELEILQSLEEISDGVRCIFGCTTESLIPGRPPNRALCEPVYEKNPPGGDSPLPTGWFRCIVCGREFQP